MVEKLGKTVLVVDDEPDLRLFLKTLLEDGGFDVSLAANGKEALDKFGITNYDLILMDWKMPGMDGVETIRMLHKDPKLHKMPKFVMVTAYGKEELAEASKDIEHLHFLTKPTNASYLLDTIMSAFGKKISSHSRRSERQEDYTEAVKQLQGAKILLVEDNEINQELALELLSNGGVITTVAGNGQEAVDMVFDDSEIGLVLMDGNMPTMTGIEAVRKIRAFGKTTPIVMVTTESEKEKVIEAIKTGANDYLVKPFNPKDIQAKLEKFLQEA